VFVANPPTEEELEQFYSFETGYHQNLRDDPDAIAYRFEMAEERYGAIAGHAQPGRLLDVGATAGFFVHAAASHGWDAHGIELSDDTASIARERYGLDVTTGRLEQVGLPSESFDAVTLWDIIEHVLDPLDTMRRVAAALKPGGIVAISTPNIDGLYPRASYRIGRLIHHWPAVEPPAHLSQFSTRTLTDLLDRAGFDVVAVKHESQPLAYTFGGRDAFRGRRGLRALAYAAVFAPLAWLGPRVRAGDEIEVVARKRVTAAAEPELAGAGAAAT
jgi:SAM-dependent methyltransferase